MSAKLNNRNIVMNDNLFHIDLRSISSSTISSDDLLDIVDFFDCFNSFFNRSISSLTFSFL